MPIKTVLGSELKVGDTINVWWTGNRDTVLSLRPYTGPLFPAGAQIATFARNTTGMTIENGHQYELVGRVGVA